MLEAATSAALGRTWSPLSSSSAALRPTEPCRSSTASTERDAGEGVAAAALPTEVVGAVVDIVVGVASASRSGRHR